MPTASALGFDTYHGSRITPAPTPVFNRAQKFLHFAIKHCGLFEIDGMTGPWLDEQPSCRDSAFQEEARFKAVNRA